MSGSRKKIPIMGVAGRRSSSRQKQFKQQEHRRERRAFKQTKKEISPKKYGNEWDSPRDGKMWFGNCKYIWPLEYKKWMRK